MSCWNLSARDFTKRSPIVTINRMDIIIFGISEGIGRYTLLAATEILKNVRWGVAGNNRRLLEDTLDYVMTKTSQDLSEVPIIIAHKEDQISLNNMAEMCKVLINCSGPYQEEGELVVEACLIAGTHHVGMSCEPHYIESMHHKYHERARRERVYIIYGCGYESFLMDVGIGFLQRYFDGTINSIEAFTEFVSMDSFFKVPIASGSAWSSFVMSCAHRKHLKKLRDRIRQKEVPRMSPVLESKPLFYTSEFVPGIIFPFPILEEQMIENSQYYMFDRMGSRPVQYRRYVTFQSQLVAVVFLIWMFFIVLMAQVSFTRNLLLEHPCIFSMGFFSRESPEDLNVHKTQFKITLHATGWTKCYKNAYQEISDEPNTSMILRITGTNPGLSISATCLLISALTVLFERSQMPLTGGIFSPGPAFQNTNIVRELELCEYGPNFELVV